MSERQGEGFSCAAQPAEVVTSEGGKDECSLCMFISRSQNEEEACVRE